MMAQNVPANLDQIQLDPLLSRAEATKRQLQNVVSLKRKITYRLNGKALQYQRVEGWTARQVLEYMIHGGIRRFDIDKYLGVRKV